MIAVEHIHNVRNFVTVLSVRAVINNVLCVYFTFLRLLRS